MQLGISVGNLYVANLYVENLSGNLSVGKFVLTCNTIHARKCKLKFVCRSPGGKTAPGFSLRGRGHPKTLVEALNTPVVAPVICLFGGGGICFLSTRPNR